MAKVVGKIIVVFVIKPAGFISLFAYVERARALEREQCLLELERALGFRLESGL